MRQVLFNIPLDRSWNLGPLGEVPGFGLGLVLVLWIMYGVWSFYRRGRACEWKLNRADEIFGLVMWCVVASAIVFGAPMLGKYLHDHGTENFRNGLPVFGYGLMLFVGFITAVAFAARRAEREGLSSEVIWDLATWLFIGGIGGARLFYLIQYGDKVFANLPATQWLFAALNFSQGGIVLYGALLGGAASFFTFCYRYHIRPLGLVDIIVPSVFIGIGFGRIGCFLNGCCFGAMTSLPWGVQFPRESTTFAALVEKGLVNPAAACTPPLHPTQIYSSIDGFMIALLTSWYFSRRRRNGEVLAVALVIYPISRFCMEFLRADEIGKFGTTLTISQWISIGLFVFNLGFMFYLSRRPAVRDPLIFPTTKLGKAVAGASPAVRPTMSASKS